MSQPWAGSNWGAIFMPRIGQEVIVDFIGGDPDYPIITGRVYNADQMPPYELPKYQEYSTIKSHSTKKGGDHRLERAAFLRLQGQGAGVHPRQLADGRAREVEHVQDGEGVVSLQIHKSHYRTVGGEFDIYIKGKLYERAERRDAHHGRRSGEDGRREDVSAQLGRQHRDQRRSTTSRSKARAV